jgi:hypothetical protein
MDAMTNARIFPPEALGNRNKVPRHHEHAMITYLSYFYKQYMYVLMRIGPGSVAQRTSHPPQEKKIRVRIPQGFKGKHSKAVVYN